MSVASGLQQSYRVRFDEAGEGGHLRSSGFLRYAQDLAWVHSEGAGFGRTWYRERGLFWLIRAVQLDVIADVPYGELLDVSTEVAGFRRVWGRRHSEFRLATTGRVVAEAIIDWVLLNSRGTPARVPTEILDLFGPGGQTFTPLRIELPTAPAMPAPPARADPTHVELVARRSEIDPLGHVNNAAYLDYLEQHLVEIGRRAELRRRPRRYLLEYVLPAEPGMTLAGEGWQAERAWHFRLSAGDSELFRARFETDPALFVGG